MGKKKESSKTRATEEEAIIPPPFILVPLPPPAHYQTTSALEVAPCPSLPASSSSSPDQAEVFSGVVVPGPRFLRTWLHVCVGRTRGDRLIWQRGGTLSPVRLCGGGRSSFVKHWVAYVPRTLDELGRCVVMMSMARRVWVKTDPRVHC
jgi:hypothetical protein